MTTPLMRIGLANPTGRMPAEMEARGVPVLVSANSLFDHRRGRFRPVPFNLADLDASLDSAGFVAMKRYGRYPWSIEQYVEAALLGGFTWWSQMDCCVEPEVASDRETVIGRIHATSQMLMLCRAEVQVQLNRAAEFAPFVTQPMPILQGWQADDYRLSAELTNEVLGGQWPDMVGVGSVCRRNLNGEAGLWRVLETIDAVLPSHVKLHLFGVKGGAMKGLRAHPRVVSLDSMSFEMHARIEARKAGMSKTIPMRIAAMERWLARQVDGVLPTGQQELALAV